MMTLRLVLPFMLFALLQPGLPRRPYRVPVESVSHGGLDAALRVGRRLGAVAADPVDDGYVVIRSDKPLLLWAWAFGQHFRGTGASEAAWSYSLAVIPVDCSDQPGKKTFFSYVCDASDGPPPPQWTEEPIAWPVCGFA